ncbi:MAG: CAP domain-containing protein, partial [Candidatus Micrarchaeales archaeon]
MGLILDLLMIILIVAVVIIFYPKIVSLTQIIPGVLSSNGRVYFPQTSRGNQNISHDPVINYTLALINKDRNAYGLANVSLSPISSGQQHADSMLEFNYFSHWDVYGLKPYMRYTLYGGKGAVEENVAYTKSGVQACIGALCSSAGNLNVSSAINKMEYNMMYNDSQCCNNGHRYNILDPKHNQVSVGLAYNGSTIYLVEDFIDNHVVWLNDTPGYANGRVYLEGSVDPNYSISSVEISYDSPVTIMNPQQLDHTSEYAYG